MAWVSCNLGDLLVSPADLDVFYSNANYRIGNTGDLNYTHMTMNIVPKTFFTSRANTFILGDATNGIKVNPASGNYWLELWHNNSRHMYLDLRLDWGNQNLIVAGYDDATQKGTIYNLIRYNGFSGSPPYDNTYDGIQNFANSVNNNIIYQILKSINIPEYTWQSVPSISGKNGILNLSQIASASINNGESVTGASASAFTSLTAQVSTMVTDDSEMSGADAGGISGSGSNSGNQSSGYAFGQGESGTNVSGGGSGYYGGEKGGSLLSGGAGSGYIGNSLVSNKKMVGYNVPTSSAEGTKTESVSVYSATKEANKPKAGNGFARVKFLREIPETLIGKWIDGKNVYEYIVSLTNAVVNDGTIQLFDVSYLNIDTIIQMHGVFQMKSAQENQYAMPSKHYESGFLYDCIDYSEGKIRAKIRYISGGSPLFTIIGTPKIVLRYTKA